MMNKRKALDKNTPKGALVQQLEQTQARIHAWVEHPFRLIQAGVRARQGQAPGAGQERRLPGGAVHTVQSVDGAKASVEHRRAA